MEREKEYRFGDMYKRCKKLANALTKKIRINNGDMVGTLHGIMPHVELYCNYFRY
jgi:fatty-acyl-CoA synthase